MAQQNRSAGNGEDTTETPATPRAKGSAELPDRTQPGGVRAYKRPSVGKRSGPREPAVNAIQASRKPERNRASPSAASAPSQDEGAPAVGSPAAASTLKHADSDPWTVPQSVRDRFVQDGHRFFFPNGDPAFRDLGRKLTTVSENTQVVASLIEIAHSRGWAEVTVTGTERFRQEAWRQARLAGLQVRGYRPSDAEQGQLIRALGRSLVRPMDRTDSISADPAAPTPLPREAGSSATTPTQATGERIAGKLLDHGPDNYRHDPNEEGSYFVRLGIPGGYREVWGRDIERAVAKSLTQPQIGDQVILQRTGRDAVTVKRSVRRADGQAGLKDVAVFRNRWLIEKREFFEQRAAAAQIVRDQTIGPQEAVRKHPELAGTYLNLRAAELAAQRVRDPQDRQQFVAQVRDALADGIERGEPLQPVRLRERAVRRLGERPERVR
jgi:conjugative element/phage-associated large polyvalent protein